MRPQSVVAAALLVLGASGVTTAAKADMAGAGCCGGPHGRSFDCAAPGPSYEATVIHNRVTICATAPDAGCPTPGGMLRVDVATGAVHKIPDYCSVPPAGGAVSPDAGSVCYVDECVPPGPYQYGYAVPLPCTESVCGAAGGDDAVVAFVTEAPSGCVSSAGPLEDAGPPPWNVDAATTSGGVIANPTCGSVAAGSAGEDPRPTSTARRPTLREIVSADGVLLAVVIGVLLRRRRGRVEA